MPKKIEEKPQFRHLPPRRKLEVANPELTPEQLDKVEKLMEFFDQNGIDYSKFTPEHRSFIEGKKAYPNYDQYMYIPGQHDMKKWMMAVKNIHYKKRAGFPFQEAVRQSTQDWKKMEIFDFLNWLRFHEEGAHMKYKTAQVWYENGQPGYFLHIKPDAQPEAVPLTDGNAVNDAREEAERNEEKRSTIEKQRSKIIGRLDSAEKLLRSPEGQQFAGNELEQLMEAIYTLKKKVQLVNKLSVSTRLYEDMIVREANVLGRKGFAKAANMLYSVAQTAGQSAESATGQIYGGRVPMDGTPPADPSGAGQSGMPNGYVNLSVNDPTQPNNVNEYQPSLDSFSADAPPPAAPPPPPPAANATPAPMAQQEAQPEGIKHFIENMNEGNKTEEVAASDDELEVMDDELHVSDPEEQLMVSEAQIAPRPGIPPAALEDVPTTDAPKPERGDKANLPPPTPKAPGGDDEPLEVTEDDIPKPAGADPAVPRDSGFDAKMDAMLANVTIADIVAELEDLSKIFKVREIPRRLSLVDMMLDSKGLASYFPSLSEAQNKALDSNNYISTRVEDILSKLRGSMGASDIDLKGGGGDASPETAGIKGKLEQDDAKEKARKDLRKQQQNAELDGGQKETPEVEMGELGAPPAPPAAPAPRPPVARPLG